MAVPYRLTLLLLVCAAFAARAGAPLPFRMTALQCDRYTTCHGARLTVAIPYEKESPNETRGATWRIDSALLERLKGRSIVFRGQVRWKDIVPAAAGSPAGGKIMAIAEVHDGSGSRTEYQVSPLCNGSAAEWQDYCAEFVIRPATQSLSIVFGIQKSSGTMEFRNLCAEASGKEVFETIWMPPADFRCEYTERVTTLPRQRGFMSPAIDKITPKDLRDMAAMGANLLRWQMNAPAAASPEEWSRRITAQLDRLETFLPLCQQLGMHVIIDLHTPPGGRRNSGALLGTADGAEKSADGSKFVMFDSDPHYLAYLEMWKTIARRFRNRPFIYGYDLYNEPAQMSFSKRDYFRCYYDCARAVREIDPETPILIESNEWASPEAFAYLKPLPFRNVIYQAHMYRHGSYTHQGVGDFATYLAEYPASRLSYPGTLNGTKFDKDFLRKAFSAVRRFQQQYHARILIGEFGVIRWAGNGGQWLDDTIDIMEEYGWDWCYHAFREWHGWSLEHSDNPHDNAPSAAMTSRMRVLLKYLDRNRDGQP